jgi:hypothetical protein
VFCYPILPSYLRSQKSGGDGASYELQVGYGAKTQPTTVFMQKRHSIAFIYFILLQKLDEK